MNCWNPGYYKQFLISILALFFGCSFFLGSIHAQVPTNITSDNSLGTQVTPNGNVYDITGGTRPENGTNLFHSFGQFSVGGGDIANFLNDTGAATNNILGRVTGGDASSIYGTIQTEGFPGADLFLMNPAGWVFGPNAALNVDGSVNFTTADYLRQNDGGLFMALSTEEDSTLSIAPIAAFGFLDGQPGTIMVEGSTLTVDQGQSISLVSGDISIESFTDVLEGEDPKLATIDAPGGAVLLASVASAGEILVDTLDQAPNINGQTFDALGAIQVSEKSGIDASGDGGGTIRIRGGQLVIDDSTISANTTGPSEGPLVGQPGEGIDIQMSKDVVIQNSALLETNVASNVAPGIGSGGVRIKADRLEILGSQDAVDSLPTRIQSEVLFSSQGGPSGDIQLEANSISVRGLASGVVIDTFAFPFSAGSTGNILLKSTGDIDIENADVLSVSQLGGNSGNIELTSAQGNIFLRGDSSVASQALTLPGIPAGTTGDITVSAPEGDVFITEGSGISTRIQAGSVEGAGGINVVANNLLLDNGSIQTDNFQPFVPGGITLNVSGRLSLDNNSDIQTTTRGPARSADLNILANDLLISGGSFISTGTFDSGDAGTLNIFTENLQVTSGAQIQSNSARLDRPNRQGQFIIPSGSGGTINVQGVQGPATTVVIDGMNSEIVTDTQGTGNAGNINISTENLQVKNGAQINSSSSIGFIPPGQEPFIPTGSGGTINIGVGSPVNSLVIEGADSGFFTDTVGIGDAGSIFVNAIDLTMSAGAEISSRSTRDAADAGDAGTVDINVSNSIAFSGSSINTSANEGEGGDIAITAGQNLQLTNQTTVSAQSEGAGNSGTVTLVATRGNFTSNNSTVSTTAQEAEGGAIAISAGQDVNLNNNTLVSAQTFGPGNAGDITLTSGNDINMTNSTISTEAAEASGGNIKLTAPNIIELTDSRIESSVLGRQETEGGNIDLDPVFIILNNSQILANATRGNGGNITLTATGAVFIDSTSVIDASSETGISGIVQINSPVSALAEVAASLPKNFVIPQNLFADACAAQAGGQFSSFTQGAPAALPPAPGGFLSSPLMLNNLSTPPSTGGMTSGSSLAQSRLGLDVGLDFSTIQLLPAAGCGA